MSIISVCSCLNDLYLISLFYSHNTSLLIFFYFFSKHSSSISCWIDSLLNQYLNIVVLPTASMFYLTYSLFHNKLLGNALLIISFENGRKASYGEKKTCKTFRFALFCERFYAIQLFMHCSS